MKNLLMFAALLIFTVGAASEAAAQTPEQNIANQPAIMKTECRNRLGRAQESLCTTDAAYNACVAYLKEGKWNYCVQAGKPGSQTIRGTFAEAGAQLLKRNCKLIGSKQFLCPGSDFNNSLGYIDCIGYRNGGGVTGCVERNFLREYADKIEAKLKNKPVGYAFVITNDEGKREDRAWGAARRSPDSTPRKMTTTAPFTLASVSKNITAAAMLKVLNAKNVDLNTKIGGFLPSDWNPKATFKDVTFRELLRHRSGIRCGDLGEVTYDNLKTCSEKMILTNLKDKNCDGNPLGTTTEIGCYENFNYAFMRILIPHVNGFSVDGLRMNALYKSDRAKFYGFVYQKYVNENVFQPAGLAAQSCDPHGNDNQGLAYKLDAPKGNGTDFGSLLSVCASQGWTMTADSLATYFRALNQSNKIVSPKIAKQMRDELFGYVGMGEENTAFGKSFRWYHSGYYPASWNPGEMNTLVMTFSNGVQISFIMNSDLPAGTNYGSAVTDAFYETMKP